MFKHPFKIGFSFGLTSGVITALGLMVGLNAGTHSRLAVIGGILTLAIADSFSDALGIHFSEEFPKRKSGKRLLPLLFPNSFLPLFLPFRFYYSRYLTRSLLIFFWASRF